MKRALDPKSNALSALPWLALPLLALYLLESLETAVYHETAQLQLGTVADYLCLLILLLLGLCTTKKNRGLVWPSLAYLAFVGHAASGPRPLLLELEFLRGTREDLAVLAPALYILIPMICLEVFRRELALRTGRRHLFFLVAAGLWANRSVETVWELAHWDSHGWLLLLSLACATLPLLRGSTGWAEPVRVATGVTRAQARARILLALASVVVVAGAAGTSFFYLLTLGRGSLWRSVSSLLYWDVMIALTLAGFAVQTKPRRWSLLLAAFFLFLEGSRSRYGPLCLPPSYCGLLPGLRADLGRNIAEFLWILLPLSLEVMRREARSRGLRTSRFGTALAFFLLVTPGGWYAIASLAHRPYSDVLYSAFFLCFLAYLGVASLGLLREVWSPPRAPGSPEL